VNALGVVKPYLSALRARDGTLQVGIAVPPRSVTVLRIAFEDGVVELFDATVTQPPLKIRLERVEGTVRGVVAPALAGRSQFALSGVVKGTQRDGRVDVAGWVELATGDSSVTTRLRSVDLVALQPYLVRVAEARVRRGALDLDLVSEVRRRRLRAPGRIALSDLELAPARGALDTFMGLPRAAVLSFLKDKDGRIEVAFVVEGDVDNARFTLNETFATRVASAVAQRLGMSLRGVVEGVGGLGRKGAEAGRDAAKGAERAPR